MFGANYAPILNRHQHYPQMDHNEIPHDPHHLGVPSGASKIISKPMVRSTQTMHLSCTNTNSVSKRTKIRFHKTHVTYEFHWVRPKCFLSLWYFRRKLCTYFASRLELLQTDRNKIPHDPYHLAVPSGASKMIFEPMIRSAQTVHLSCVKISTMSERTEMSFHLSLVT